MKRVLAGGFLSLIGTIWSLAIIICAGNNLTTGWATPPGRFLTTVIELGLVVPLFISVTITFLGIIAMLIESFLKDR